jgi:hypothetical protein
MRILIALGTIMLLISCGGGGDSGTANTPTNTQAQTANTSTNPAVTLPVTPPVTPPAIPPETPPVAPITAAPTCAALKNGQYELLDALSSGAAQSAARLSFDALAMATTEGSSVTTWVADTTACSFTAPSGKSLVISAAGIGFLRTLNTSGKTAIKIMVPVQSFSALDLAGRFNYVSFDRVTDDTTYNTNSGFFRFNTAGLFESAWICRYGGADENTCNQGFTPTGFSANANGGFNATDVNGEALRIFGFKSATGAKVLFMVRLDAGGLIVATSDTSLLRPALNSQLTERKAVISSFGQAGSWISSTYTTTALDTLNLNQYTRRRSGDNLFENIEVNTPSAGIAIRREDASYGNIMLPMSSLGFTAIVDTLNNSLGFSVNQ